MLRGFRDFVLRGNVIDLAVAVVIGAAFTKIVTAFVDDFINPLLGAIVRMPNLVALQVRVHGGVFRYGDFVNAVIYFILVSAVVYFFVVLPINSLMHRFHKAPPAAPPTTRPCPQCLSEIPLAAARCAHCAQPVPVIS